MFKKLFRKLKRFFKRIGAAFKELFTGEEPETVEAEIVTPKKEKKKSEFFEWLTTIGCKIGNSIKRSVESFADNPFGWVLKFGGVGFIGGLGLSGVRGIRDLFATPTANFIRKREEMYKVVDPHTGITWKVNVPLTENDKQQLRYRSIKEKRELADILADLGLLA